MAGWPRISVVQHPHTAKTDLILSEIASQALSDLCILPHAQSNLVLPIGSATGKTISNSTVFIDELHEVFD
jgi:hypothetical protein